MASVPTIHVIDKSDYIKQHIVALPGAFPLPSLAPSSVRIKSSIISLTVNNFTYARLGHLRGGWWDIHLLPPSTPSAFADRTKYGRISAWGYAEIIESTVPSLPVGTQLYGFMPIGTLPEDLEVKPFQTRNQIQVTSAHRQHTWNIYNRYYVHTLAEEKTPEDSLGWDALMRPLFETGFALNRYVLAWDDAKRVDASGTKLPDWTAADADIHDGAVVVLSASGKTATSFAHQLRRNRPLEAQPKLVVGASSALSQEFTQNTGFYDKVILYSDTESAKSAISAAGVSKAILVDFSAREGVVEAWHAALSPIVPVVFLRVGGEATVKGHEEIIAAAGKLAKLGLRQANVSAIRDAGMAMGEQAYMDEVEVAWEGFKKEGAIPGVELRWRDGMEEWAKGWDGLAKGEIGPQTGLLFRL